MEWQTNQLITDALGDRTIAFVSAKAASHIGKMQGQVMKDTVNAALAQIHDESLAQSLDSASACKTYDMTARNDQAQSEVEHHAYPPNPLDRLDTYAKNSCDALDSLALFQLAIKIRRKNIGWQERRTDIHPRIFIHLSAEEAGTVGPFFTDDLGALRQRRIIDQQCAAFPAAKVFCLMEGLSRQRTERSKIFAFVFSKQSMRVIFDNFDSMRYAIAVI